MERDTKLIHAGSGPDDHYGFVNQPIYRGSTVIYENVKALDEALRDPFKKDARVYGRLGTPAARNFESIIAELEGGAGAITTCSGLSAISTAILAFVEAGDHILITDSAYYPTRSICQYLKKLGVETEFYDPNIGEGIRSRIRKTTRLVYLESPGSLTFEIQDVSGIAGVCRELNIISLIDNTWGTPLYSRPLELGIDVSIHSATKYITGHSDSFLGVIICGSEKVHQTVRTCALNLGQCAGADDIYLALRGLKTLSVRLKQHQAQALDLAVWLQGRDEVQTVLYPALAGSPGHELWKRDFAGAPGLFSIVLDPRFSLSQVTAMVDSLDVFGIGHSWGGFESLIIPSTPGNFRTHGDWKDKKLLRLHVGFEDLRDLKRDLEHGFGVLRTKA